MRNAVSDFLARYVAADTSNSVAAIVAMYNDSVRVDVRGAPVLMGRGAVQAFLEPVFKTVRYTSMSFMPDMTIPVTSDLAYQNGSYTEGSTAGGKKMMDFGRYAMGVARGTDGQWRITYLMAFSDSIVPVKK